MEEHGSSSMVSTAKMNIITSKTTSDSFETNSEFRSRKRPRLETEVSSVKFKGVVAQQNGHWGAQIYANHQRIWLGTFKSEKEAAMSYDSAAIKLRTGDSHRNFPWTDRTIQEPAFQNQFTLDAILSMIRDGSYQPKFADFIRTKSQKEEHISTRMDGRAVHRDGHFSFIQLFQKELTPSDVGKLNRLVIPKKFAVKYFPYICEGIEDEGAGIDDVELMFYDRKMQPWKFRYCYWRSSQSFVFTRGWNRFVKEKKLKEKDTVTFYTCICPDERVENGRHFYLIDINYSDHGKNSEVDGVEEMEKELELKLGQTLIRNNIVEKDEKKMEEKDSVKDEGLRLFGVRIS